MPRPILPALLFAVLVLASTHAAAGPVIDVQIAQPRSQLVAQRELRSYCNTSREINGCTVLLGPRLTCRCARDERGYRLTASAQIIPYVYFTNGDVERHEQAHLDDLRAQIEEWFSGLAARSFDSKEECNAVGDFESAVFALRMDLFRRKSNERLH